MTDEATPSRRSRRKDARRTKQASSLRWPAVILIPALLAGMWLLDDDDPEPVAAEPASHALGPTIASDDSLGAFWFCSGGTGTPDGAANHGITILNTTAEERFAVVTVYGSRPDGGERPEPVPINTQVLPYARIDIALGQYLASPYVSATVEIDGGGVLVEHGVASPTGGADRGPCATTASDRWSVPAGSTDTAGADRTSTEVLVFFNPYAADAVVDVTFSTSEGVRDPEDFRGFVVPGRGVVGVDLAAADVTLSADVAAEVVARTGRVVVDRLQVYAQPDPPRAGVALTSGVAEAAEAWTFAVGGQDANIRERLLLYNPGDVVADVDVEIRPDESGTVAANEPFEITIQPHRHEALDLATEERMQELLTAEPPTPYSIIVRSADGTRITAERMRWGTPGTAGGGVGSSTGSALASRRLVADMSGAEAGSTLVLLNPSTDTIARVTLAVIDSNGVADGDSGTLHAPDGGREIELAPGARRAVDVAQLGAGRFAVVVESDVPIVGERDVLIGTERFTAIAVPDAATAVIAQLSLFADDLGG